MFIALYRWKVKPDQESQFKLAWARITREMYQKRGSLGSRLHQVEDGTWLAYAQWPSRQVWERRQQELTDTEAQTMLHDSIQEAFPAVHMQVIDDLLTTTIA